MYQKNFNSVISNRKWVKRTFFMSFLTRNVLNKDFSEGSEIIGRVSCGKKWCSSLNGGCSNKNGYYPEQKKA